MGTVLVRVNGKPATIVSHDKMNDGKRVYQPATKKNEWIKPIPIISVVVRGK